MILDAFRPLPLRRLAAVAVLLLATACGVQGQNGQAVFMVANNWQTGTPIALESTFAVSAHKTGLIKTQLVVESGNPQVFAQQANGFKAVGVGEASFRALDPSTKQEIDLVTFEVAKPASASLSYWPDKILNANKRLEDSFAVYGGARVLVRPELEDAQKRPLNHEGVVTLQAANAVAVKVVPDGARNFQLEMASTATATALELGVAGAASLDRSYQVQVVDQQAVASLELDAVVVQLTVANVDASKPEQPPVEGEAEPTSDSVFLLLAKAKTTDGLRIYGAGSTWTVLEGTAKLVFAGKSTELQYVVLEPGEKLKVRVELNGKTAEREIQG